MNRQSNPKKLLSGLHALRNEVVFSTVEGSVILEVSGADRRRFLHGFVTAEVKTREVGDTFFTFFTDVKGKVLADGYASVGEDALYLEIPAEQGPFLEGHLRKYIIADRVELRRRPWKGFRLWGPRALEAVEVPGDLKSGRGVLEVSPTPQGIRLVERRERYGLSSITFWFEEGGGAPWAERIRSEGILSVSSEALEIHRVEEAVPRWGRDYDQNNLPQESGLGNRAVSYEKGCYLGQEIVARIHYRGGVQRSMVRLNLEGVAPAAQELEYEGRTIGKIGTVVESPTQGWIALALVHRRGAEPGTELSWPGGLGVVVAKVELN